MSFFKKEEGRDVEVPEGFMRGDGISRRTFFKIIVKEVTEISKPELEETYVHTETGKIVSNYDYNYKLEDSEKEKYIRIRKETGDVEVKEKERDILEQSKENLDIGELALFINRAR